MKYFIYCICVLMLSSCSIFRKNKTEHHFTSSRDSTGKIDTKVDLSKAIMVNSKGEVIELNAIGFREIKVNPDGSIDAKGENGKLNLTKQSGSKDSLSNSNLSTTQKEETKVKDKVEDQGESLEIRDTKPDPWFTTWTGAVVGAVIIGIAILILKKIDLKKYMPWLK